MCLLPSWGQLSIQKGTSGSVILATDRSDPAILHGLRPGVGEHVLQIQLSYIRYIYIYILSIIDL